MPGMKNASMILYWSFDVARTLVLPPDMSWRTARASIRADDGNLGADVLEGALEGDVAIGYE
jgi:hypothetical protein